jgi:methylenetetrahydrofolate dehydrogenase (NADP+)/methenyltetrahydrofolate cyclohydrolase
VSSDALQGVGRSIYDSAFLSLVDFFERRDGKGSNVGRVIDGRAIAEAVRGEVAGAVSRVRDARGVVPGLATVLVGDDQASRVYVRTKERTCGDVGIASFSHRLPATVAEAELLALVDELNAQADVHGILVQLPLPAGIDQAHVLERIHPSKDVDGLHPYNQGMLIAGRTGLRPCTPLGVMRLIDETGVSLAGKRTIVLGRSVLVGKPVALMLLERHATVTLCHSRSADLPGEIGRAECVVSAMGRPLSVAGEWIRPGAVVIDVGISRLPSGAICGDVDFEGAKERAGFITPVPGGVGPMTVAMLLANTVQAARRQLGC